MSDQTAATLYFLAPFALLWLAFAAAETRRVLAAIRGRK
jgi:hypothetical protein